MIYVRHIGYPDPASDSPTKDSTVIHEERVQSSNFPTTKDVFDGSWNLLLPQRLQDFCAKRNKQVLHYVFEDTHARLVTIVYYVNDLSEEDKTFIKLSK